MTMTNLEDLYVHFLRDIYFAEKQILKTLPKMARRADADELRTAFEAHHHETEQQIENLETVFEQQGLSPRGVTCEAILGILDEGKEIMEAAQDPIARDAGMIAAAQAVEHYEITRYGTLIDWARHLGREDAAKLLEQNLAQEKAADEKLTKLAREGINRRAA